MAQRALPEWKANFMNAALAGGVLKFGTFELKSKRVSPYFFNAGEFYRADLLEELSSAFAQTIIEAQHATDLAFDVIFGPAYKGIPLATAITLKLAKLDPDRYSNICYAFDRKEAKGHGEGGTIVGAPLKGKKVLIVDDVITAGTAKREALRKIAEEGGTVTAIVVALDRMEKLPGPGGDDSVPMPSAMAQIMKEFCVPILSVLSLDDIIDGMAGSISADDMDRIRQYRIRYKPSEQL